MSKGWIIKIVRKDLYTYFIGDRFGSPTNKAHAHRWHYKKDAQKEWAGYVGLGYLATVERA